MLRGTSRGTAELYSPASTANLRVIHAAANYIVRRAPDADMYTALRTTDPNSLQLEHLNSLYEAVEFVRARRALAKRSNWADYDTFEAETVVQRVTEFLTGPIWRSSFANLKNGEQLRLRAAERHSHHMAFIGLLDFNRTTGLYAYDPSGGLVRYYTSNPAGGFNVAYGVPATEIVDGTYTEQDLEGVAEAMEAVDAEIVQEVLAKKRESTDTVSAA